MQLESYVQNQGCVDSYSRFYIDSSLLHNQVLTLVAGGLVKNITTFVL